MDIESRMIEFPSNEHATPGYFARPTENGEFPGVVVIQEWWGITAHIKDVTERFARDGFVALAPDLYYGKTADEPDEARKLAMALDGERAIREVAASAKYLVGLEYVMPKKAGVVGWCMGGALSLSAAARNGNIGAVVAFYGRPLDASDTAKVNAPVLGLYGELDQGIPVSIVRDFGEELKNNGIEHEIEIYADAQHAFFNDTRPQSYDSEASADAWKRTLGWFQKHLS